MSRLAVITAVAVAVMAAAGCDSAPPELSTPGRPSAAPRLVPPAPPAPDLNGYIGVTAGDYRVDGHHLAFRTPDGLACEIGPQIGCDGMIGGTLAPANEVVLNGAPTPTAGPGEPDSFRQTPRPRFTGPAGLGAKLLPPRHKIVVNDLQCAVDTGGITMCTRGLPLTGWFILSPNRSAIGPRVAGLPPKFPDPHDFVVDDQNASPYFTVESGLTCNINLLNGGVFGCDGPLPGIADGDNEIYVDLPAHKAGLRSTDKPRFTTIGTVRELPVWQRIDDTHHTFTTCLAGSDGAVACYAQAPDHARGFVVSAHSAWTFGDDTMTK